MPSFSIDQAPGGLIYDPSAHAIPVAPFGGGNTGYTTPLIITKVGLRDGAGLLDTNTAGQGFDLWLGSSDAGASGRGGNVYFRIGAQNTTGGNGIFSLLDSSGNQSVVSDPSNKALYLYNTLNTDHVSSSAGPTNFERLSIGWSGNVCTIGPVAGGTGVTRQLRFALGTVTASTPLDITQTWNNAGVAFTALSANITDTASAANSYVADFQLNSVSHLRVQKGIIHGFQIAASPSGYPKLCNITHGIIDGGFIELVNTVSIGRGNTVGMRVQHTQVEILNGAWLGFSASNNDADLSIYRDAADTLAQRRGTNPQSLRVYNTFTNASNYERLAINWSGNICTITTEAAGTGSARGLVLNSGAGGNIIFQTGGVEIFRGGNTSNVGVFTLSRLDCSSFAFTTHTTGINSRAAGVIGLNTSTNSTGSGSGTLASTPLSPTALSADQNNYNPGVARRYRLASDGNGARTITGLAISQVDGQEFSIVNVGTNNLTFSHQSASSTAANRFICTGGVDIVLATDEELLGWYDNTTQRYRLRKI